MRYNFLLRISRGTFDTLQEDIRLSIFSRQNDEDEILIDRFGPTKEHGPALDSKDSRYSKYADEAEMIYSIAVVQAAVGLSDYLGPGGVAYMRSELYWFVVGLTELMPHKEEGFIAVPSVYLESGILSDSVLSKNLLPFADFEWEKGLYQDVRSTALTYGDSLYHSIIAISQVFMDRTRYQEYGLEFNWPSTEREAYDMAIQMAEKYFIPSVAENLLKSRAYRRSEQMRP